MGAAQRVKRIYRAVDVWAGAAQRVKRPIERWRESASAPAHLCDTPSTYCYTTQHLLLHDPAPIVTRPSTYCYTTQHLSFTRGGEGGRAGQSPSGGGRHQHQATCMFSWGGGGGSWGAPRCTGTCWGVQAGAERHGSEGGGGGGRGRALPSLLGAGEGDVAGLGGVGEVGALVLEQLCIWEMGRKDGGVYLRKHMLGRRRAGRPPPTPPHQALARAPVSPERG